MMIKAGGKQKLIALFKGGKPISTQRLAPTDCIATSLDVVSADNEVDFLGALPASSFKPLPNSGYLEKDEIYEYNGRLVMVRQSHARQPQYSPDKTPTLFIEYRPDAAKVLDWIPGERVHVGTQRTYDGKTHEALQEHVTQEDWIPPKTPALWKEVKQISEVELTKEWAAGVKYGVGSVVTYSGVKYECLQAHTSLIGWEPPRVPALWKPL